MHVILLFEHEKDAAPPVESGETLVLAVQVPLAGMINVWSKRVNLPPCSLSIGIIVAISLSSGPGFLWL